MVAPAMTVGEATSLMPWQMCAVRPGYWLRGLRVAELGSVRHVLPRGQGLVSAVVVRVDLLEPNRRELAAASRACRGAVVA
jgi:hypothetical protein